MLLCKSDISCDVSETKLLECCQHSEVRFILGCQVFESLIVRHASVRVSLGFRVTWLLESLSGYFHTSWEKGRNVSTLERLIRALDRFVLNIVWLEIGLILGHHRLSRVPHSNVRVELPLAWVEGRLLLTWHSPLGWWLLLLLGHWLLLNLRHWEPLWGLGCLHRR